MSKRRNHDAAFKARVASSPSVLNENQWGDALNLQVQT